MAARSPTFDVTLTPTVKRTQGAAELNVVLNIDASRIVFTAAEGRHLAGLDLVIYAADDKERLIKESRHKIDLKLKDENYQRYLREGIPFEVTMRAAQSAKVREGHRLRLRRRPARLLHRQAEIGDAAVRFRTPVVRFRTIEPR